ncbi:nickel pincer cofactor biosynthesis protein LarC [candidate division KSB1 bacterium]|nr:nickel pincer cofactor biosynthesis protein LarC [candidate division KSB1 bacterium]
MKIAYFDCFAGASGDMILGSLIDVGLACDQLRHELARLKVSGYEIQTQAVEKMHLAATSVQVNFLEPQPPRHLTEITEIIQKSTLSATVKAKSIQIFTRLAHAEAKIHRTTPNEIHFHEVGGVDAIVDIVGAVVGLELLEIEQLFVSAFPAGYGFVDCAHGRLPVPAPATLELLQNFPVIQRSVEGELVTPTGAAILTTLAQNHVAVPEFTIQKVGYGAGKKNFPFPNVLRLILGEVKGDLLPPAEELILLEANIDDLNPEVYTHVFQVLFSAGARDVYLTPIIMKKNRPGTMLSVLSEPAQAPKLTQLIFQETSTFGLRQTPLARIALAREYLKVTTKYGAVRIKLARLGSQILQAAPEFSDCQALAQTHHVPIKEIYNHAIAAYYSGLNAGELQTTHGTNEISGG